MTCKDFAASPPHKQPAVFSDGHLTAPAAKQKERSQENHFSGILLIDKPEGLTSFQVVSRLRLLTGIKKVGHCGTLDPFATGLLPVCLGPATKMIQFMEAYDKQYEVTVSFGRATDTQDRTGRVCAEKILTEKDFQRLADNWPQHLQQAADQLTGSLQQLPPMYSAVKVGGKKLYQYARAGETVARAARPIDVYRFELISSLCDPRHRLLEATFRIDCSKGTYIRVLAAELGRLLGLPAHAQALRRTACGPFQVTAAHDLEDLFQIFSRLTRDPAAMRAHLSHTAMLLAPEQAVSHLPVLEVPRELARALVHGQPVWRSEIPGAQAAATPTSATSKEPVAPTDPQQDGNQHLRPASSESGAPADSQQDRNQHLHPVSKEAGAAADPQQDGKQHLHPVSNESGAPADPQQDRRHHLPPVSKESGAPSDPQQPATQGTKLASSERLAVYCQGRLVAVARWQPDAQELNSRLKTEKVFLNHANL